MVVLFLQVPQVVIPPTKDNSTGRAVIPEVAMHGPGVSEPILFPLKSNVTEQAADSHAENYVLCSVNRLAFTQFITQNIKQSTK